MLFYILDKNFELLTPIEDYVSYIWTKRFQASGDFELYLPATSELIDLFKSGKYVLKKDDPTTCMIIKNMQIQTDIEQGNHIIVTGKSAKNILSQRIIWSQTTLNGTPEVCMRQLVNANLINPTVTARKISNVVLGELKGITGSMSAQYTGNNLEETIQAICKTNNLGYDLLYDFDTQKFTFVVLQGTDRTTSQNDNPRVIFSNAYDNLLTTDYIYNSDEYKNVAKVGGEGEGSTRKFVSVGTAEGIDRFEIFVDSRNSSTNNGEIDNDTYEELLTEEGFEELTNYQISETISGQVDHEGTFKINEDYFLGDFVEVINEYGVSMVAQILEIIESEDESGYYIIPSFSSN